MYDVPFYDDVMRFCMRPQSPFFRRPSTEAILREYRQTLIGARRFVLDDNFVREAALLAGTNLNTLEDRAQIASRLPFDRVWIEWDQHVRVQKHLELGRASQFDPNTVSQKNGYLLTKESDQSWSATYFVNDERIGVCPNLLDLTFSMDGPVARSDRRSVGEIIPSLDNARYMLYGIGTRDNLDYRHEIGLHEWMQDTVQIFASPFWTKSLDADGIYQQVREDQGIMRFLLTVLALLNASPTESSPSTPRKGRYVGGGRSFAYLDHDTISVRLPKLRKRTSDQFLSDLLQRRAAPLYNQKVRGHDRTIMRNGEPKTIWVNAHKRHADLPDRPVEKIYSLRASKKETV